MRNVGFHPYACRISLGEDWHFCQLTEPFFKAIIKHSGRMRSRFVPTCLRLWRSWLLRNPCPLHIRIRASSCLDACPLSCCSSSGFCASQVEILDPLVARFLILRVWWLQMRPWRFITQSASRTARRRLTTTEISVSQSCHSTLTT